MRVWPPTSTTSSMSRVLHLGVAEGALHRREGALDQVADQLLQLGAGQGDVQVLRPLGVRRDERQVDLGLWVVRKLDLGLLGGLLQALQGHAVLAQVDALVAS